MVTRRLAHSCGPRLDEGQEVFLERTVEEAKAESGLTKRKQGQL